MTQAMPTLLGRPYRNYRAGVLRLKGAKIGPVVFKSPLSSIVFKDLVFQHRLRHAVEEKGLGFLLAAVTLLCPSPR